MWQESVFEGRRIYTGHREHLQSALLEELEILIASASTEDRRIAMTCLPGRSGFEQHHSTARREMPGHTGYRGAER